MNVQRYALWCWQGKSTALTQNRSFWRGALLLLTFAVASVGEAPREPIKAAEVYVIDDDTIRFRTNTYRLVGFDTPEIWRALLSSGMYDLKPVRLSKRSNYLKFTDEVEVELSTQRHIDRIRCPIIVAYGNQETPEFQRQARDFAAALKAAGRAVQLLTGSYNHFELPETLGNPFGLLGRAVPEQMRLPQPFA